MTACPSCFEQLRASEFAWICQASGCTQALDPVASGFVGSEVHSGPIILLSRPADAAQNWAPPARIHCRQCAAIAQEACANCHFPLPENWRSFDVTTIAMSGARWSGKSFYIAVAVQQLRNVLTHLHTSLDFADSRSRDVYRMYFQDPLFGKLKIIQATPRSNTEAPPQRYPLIFRLGSLKGAQRMLVIRDVAGEDLEATSEDMTSLSFLRHADSVFFMFDPLAIPAIREHLRGLVPDQLNTGGDPRLVLGNIRRLMGNASPALAIIVSKFDALQALRNVDDMEWKPIMSNPGAAFLRDPSLDSGTYDKVDGELLSLEVESLLHKLGAQDFVYALEGGKPIPHRYFAVSVLGESTDGESISRLGISPFRILDPIKWVLDLKKII
ncbi:hypothetical protein SAMN06296378_0623 [Salinibacterium xinjiangense]|uniref:Double-GTPase 2 domain-containing protein n=1 Tax=Salinibacterium xinjiangense TaxID=386302 RepID=A0A2C8YT93_9MICO|nr:hypothetical protein [Salinibacterium xinjiangense]SOE53881.1 hypothetical protein SAMN06296378_0623 [Salinibacterium xinjiangense]